MELMDLIECIYIYDKLWEVYFEFENEFEQKESC